MDKPDRVFLGPPVKHLPDGGAVFRAGDAYLLATPERELASELVEALRKCQQELDDYSAQEYPLDHPVHERYRKRDYDANPARAVLAKLEGKG